METVDDLTKDIIVIDMKPHQRCCRWIRNKMPNKPKWYTNCCWSLKRKWRVWKWYLCYFCFIASIVGVVIVLKLPWSVPVDKDKNGNCPLYSH